jgi:DNA-binding NarL/FixJ family response regulator
MIVTRFPAAWSTLATRRRRGCASTGCVRRGACRAGRPAVGWASLTPAEAQVAELVQAGPSNPDIAAELFLSRHTVESHVSRILTELGAKSRREVAAAARPPEHGGTA